MQQTEQIFSALPNGHIAADGRDAHHVQFRGCQGEQNGQRIIDPGVGINNDFGWRIVLHA